MAQQLCRTNHLSSRYLQMRLPSHLHLPFYLHVWFQDCSALALVAPFWQYLRLAAPTGMRMQSILLSVAAGCLQAIASAGQDCTELSTCPACMVPVRSTCVGGHVKQEQACSEHGLFSCGQECSRPLACGNHTCALACHAVATAEQLVQQRSHAGVRGSHTCRQFSAMLSSNHQLRTVEASHPWLHAICQPCNVAGIHAARPATSTAPRTCSEVLLLCICTDSSTDACR